MALSQTRLDLTRVPALSDSSRQQVRLNMKFLPECRFRLKFSLTNWDQIPKTRDDVPTDNIEQSIDQKKKLYTYEKIVPEMVCQCY